MPWIPLFIVLFVVAPVAQGAWPNAFPDPPDSTVQWVADDMVFNGVPMMIRVVKSELLSKRIFDYYTDWWGARSAEGQGPKFVQTPDWGILSWKDGEALYTVQLSDVRHGSYGYLGISGILAVKEPLQFGQKVPRLRGTTVLNEINQNDLYKTATTYLLQNDYSVAANVNFYKKHYNRASWDLQAEHAIDRDAHYLLFKRGGEESTMTIQNNDRGAMITINHVKVD